MHARTHGVRMCGPQAHSVGSSPHSTHFHCSTALDEHRTLQHSDWCYASPYAMSCGPTTAIAPITSEIPLEGGTHAISQVPCPAGGSGYRQLHPPLEADATSLLHALPHALHLPAHLRVSSLSILLPPSSILALFGFLFCCRRRLTLPSASLYVSEFTSGMSSSSHKCDSSEQACTQERHFAIR